MDSFLKGVGFYIHQIIVYKMLSNRFFAYFCTLLITNLIPTMKKLFLSFAALALVASVYSCRETTKDNAEETAESIQTDTENALDQADEAIDQAAEDTQDALEDAGEAVKEAADDVKEDVQDATDGN